MSVKRAGKLKSDEDIDDTESHKEYNKCVRIQR
jgi:hypothetical protein